MLIAKVRRAVEATGRTTVVLGGGVACSQTLQAVMSEALRGHARVAVSRREYNTDNAAMIARTGWYHLSSGRHHALDLEASARFPWPGLSVHHPATPTPR